MKFLELDRVWESPGIPFGGGFYQRSDLVRQVCRLTDNCVGGRPCRMFSTNAAGDSRHLVLDVPMLRTGEAWTTC